MFRQTTDRRVAAFFADGLEECEALVVCDCLFRSGIPVDKVSITDRRAVTSSHEVTVVCDRSITDDDFSFGDYDMLFLPGGMPGTTNLGECTALMGAVREQVVAGRDLAAVCAAPSLLARLGLLEGRHATSNPDFQQMLTDHGATVLQDPVVIDGNLITSKGLGTCVELGLALVRRILSDGAAETLKDQIVYLR